MDYIVCFVKLTANLSVIFSRHKYKKCYCPISGVVDVHVHKMLNFLHLSFKNVIFSKPFDTLLNNCHGDTYWSRFLFSPVPNPDHDLEVKDPDRNFLLKFLHSKFLRFHIF